jgi:N-acetylglucosamine-6-phosphate deacetylase
VPDTITARRALVGGAIVGPVRLTHHRGTIVEVSVHTGACDHDLLAPGFVDLQVNGIDDVDVAAASGSDWDRLDSLLLAQGTTTWCPTLISSTLGSYASRLAAITTAATRVGEHPTIAGVHLEGPFLGGAPGAHRRDLIVDIDLEWLDGLPPVVRMITLGPEQPAAPEAIRRLRARGVVVSLGHTTASTDDCDRAAAAGATMVTHLFNAMTGLHHRTPGVAAWALHDQRVTCGLIADGVHVHPRMLRLAADLLGSGRTVLVTDAVAWRARTVGPVTLQVVDGAPRLPDGTLAGSTLTMDRAVRTMVAAGIPLSDALTAASATPATVLGLGDRGALAPGRRADLVAFDGELQVRTVWVAGRRLR